MALRARRLDRCTRHPREAPKNLLCETLCALCETLCPLDYLLASPHHPAQIGINPP